MVWPCQFPELICLCLCHSPLAANVYFNPMPVKCFVAHTAHKGNDKTYAETLMWRLWLCLSSDTMICCCNCDTRRYEYHIRIPTTLLHVFIERIWFKAAVFMRGDCNKFGHDQYEGVSQLQQQIIMLHVSEEKHNTRSFSHILNMSVHQVLYVYWLRSNIIKEKKWVGRQ